MYFFFASRSSDFINHSYDYRPNWTPHNPITIIIISKVETFVCAVLATAKWPKFCFEANGYLSVDFTSTYTLPNHEREFLFYGHAFVSDFVTTLVTHFAQFARRQSRHLGRRLQECVYDNRPWHFFRCRFLVLFGWTFACHSRCRQRKRFFMPLQEFVVHFKTGKNLWLTLKNAFVCFQLFKRWWWFWKHFWMTL